MPDNDLISREALIEDLSYCAPELFFDKDFLLYKIMRQPVIEAEPVRRGRWIDHGSYVTCSERNEEQYGIDTGRFYCQNCGARMESEVE